MERTGERTGTLRIGLVGAGFIGTTVGGEFHRHPDATVAAVTDVNEEALTEAAELFSVPESERYEGHERMFAEAGLDAALVGTPHTLHYEQVVDALDAGLDVLCDKPLTTDLAEARDLHERVRGSERTLMVGYQRHLNPSFVAARERWAEGDREPQWITAEVTQNWVERFRDTWRTDPDLNGGGYLYDTGSHLLDAVLWTTGLEPTAVAAEMSFLDDEERVDERASLNVRFANGATATVSTYGDAPAVREHIHVWDGDGAVYLDGREWEPREYAEIDAESGTHTPYIDPESRPTKAEAFVEAVREGTEPPAMTWDGVRVTAVTEAAYEAARTGEWVDVDLSR